MLHTWPLFIKSTLIFALFCHVSIFTFSYRISTQYASQSQYIQRTRVWLWNQLKRFEIDVAVLLGWILFLVFLMYRKIHSKLVVKLLQDRFLHRCLSCLVIFLRLVEWSILVGNWWRYGRRQIGAFYRLSVIPRVCWCTQFGSK